MKTLAAIVNRVLTALPSLVGVVVVTFLLARALPGDPAAYYAGSSATPESIAQIRAQLGLDKPLIAQFGDYVVRLAHGDLGRSISSGQSVFADLSTRLPASAELTLAALGFALVIGLPLGVLAALKQGTWADHICRVVVSVGAAFPTFFVALMFVFVFYYELGIAPEPLGRFNEVYHTLPPTITGFLVIDSLLAGDFEAFSASLAQLMLPAASLGLFALAPIARVARAAMLEALASDYVRTARAMGLSSGKVALGYALRNAMLPIVNVLGMVFSFLLGANVLVEQVFAWPGVGAYAVHAVIASDYAAVQGFVLTMAVLYVLLNLVVDVAVATLDPECASVSDATFLADARYLATRNRLTLIAGLVLLGFIVLAAVGPWVAPYDPLMTNSNLTLAHPSLPHPFGADALGRDILSRVIVATRLDISMAIGAVAISFALGTWLGALAGYFGGWIDTVIGRLMDTIMAFPLFVLAMGIVAALGNSVANIVLATAIINLPFYARFSRAEISARRELAYVEAAKMSGHGGLTILTKHLIPNILPVMTVQASLNLGWAILNAAGLSFIGLGVRPPTPEWGIMVSEGASYIFSGEWWTFTFPGFALVLAVFCFNLIGDGLRDIIDPRTRT